MSLYNLVDNLMNHVASCATAHAKSDDFSAEDLESLHAKCKKSQRELLDTLRDLHAACVAAAGLFDELEGVEMEYRAALEIRARLLPAMLAIVKDKP